MNAEKSIKRRHEDLSDYDKAIFDIYKELRKRRVVLYEDISQCQVWGYSKDELTMMRGELCGYERISHHCEIMLCIAKEGRIDDIEEDVKELK